LVSFGDAAQALGVSIATLRRWEGSGKLADGSVERTEGGQGRYDLAVIFTKYFQCQYPRGKGWSPGGAALRALRRVTGLAVLAAAFLLAGCATKKDPSWCPPKRADVAKDVVRQA
jgi:hypothetical protein